MQLQFENKAIRCLSTALLEAQHTEQTQELRLADGMPDIGRVISAVGQVLIKSKEWQGNTILLTGVVQVRTLYAPEDGTQVRSVEGWVPYQLKWEIRDDIPEGQVRVLPLLRFADSRSISSRKMMLRVGVSVLLQAFSPTNPEVFTPGKVPEDVQLLYKKYPLTAASEYGERIFRMDEELSLPGQNSDEEKLLSATVEPEMSEVRISGDKVILKGALQLHLMFRNQDGTIRCVDESVPVSQLSQLDRSFEPDASADVMMAVTDLETDISESGKLRLKCDLVAQYLVYERMVLELVQDAYSTHRPVKPESSILRIPALLDSRTESVTAEQSIPGQEGAVACGAFLPDIPQQRNTANGTDLDLKGMFQMLICNEEQSLKAAVSRWEGKLPRYADDQAKVLVTAVAPGKVHAVATPEGMDLSTKIQLSLQTVKTEQITMVTGLELGEIGPENHDRPSVIIVNCADRPLWEIAKECNSTVSAICGANGLEEESSAEGLLLIPVIS